MVNRLVTATILLACLATVAPAIAKAQGHERIQVNIPFAFVVREQVLPAGRYVVERTDPGRPNVLTLRSTAKGVVRFILTQRVEKTKSSAASSLVFIEREGKLYLFQVWNVGAMNGVQIPSAPDRDTRDRRRESLTLVTLRLDDH